MNKTIIMECTFKLLYAKEQEKLIKIGTIKELDNVKYIVIED